MNDINAISDYVIRRCPICGKLYMVWSTIGSDQSICANCKSAGFPFDYFKYNGTANAPWKGRSTSISQEQNKHGR